MFTLHRKVNEAAILCVLSVATSIAIADEWEAFRNLDFMMAGDRRTLVWCCAGPLFFLPAMLMGDLLALLSLSGWTLWRGRAQLALLWSASMLILAGAAVFEATDLGMHGVSPLGHGHFLDFLQVGFCMLLGGAALAASARKGGEKLRGFNSSASKLPAQRTTRWRMILRSAVRAACVLGLMATSGTAILASVTSLFLLSCEPPSVDRLAYEFPSRQVDLETLLRMSRQDGQMLVIDPEWTETKSGSSLSGPHAPVLRADGTVAADAGLSKDRYDAYLNLFRRAGLGQGLRRFGESGDIFFIVKSVGLLDRGYSNGYLFCGPGPHEPPAYEPCTSVSPQGRHDSTASDESYEFRRVADHWYAYREGPL